MDTFAYLMDHIPEDIVNKQVAHNLKEGKSLKDRLMKDRLMRERLMKDILMMDKLIEDKLMEDNFKAVNLVEDMFEEANLRVVQRVVIILLAAFL